ncbi:hypothetical protein [Fervidibacillus albus]|uniref:Uncharacterized protein n=1 Tax=Fervidibacillus albus TaxID=2980026 RepID=A0A9E8LU82_9BACI|nr:hypothetical protein [Fervidibacillus albus]WAA08904.1 hypothetical protein OE104_09825 [Fervidibacillus albus]
MKKESLLKKIFRSSKNEQNDQCCNVTIEEIEEEKPKKGKDSCCNVVIEEIEE